MIYYDEIDRQAIVGLSFSLPDTALVRLSGWDIHEFAHRALSCTPANDSPIEASLLDEKGERFCTCTALLWSPERSPTGEPCLDLTIVSGRTAGQLLIAAAVRWGARAATQSEFLLRGFLNGTSDLVYCETIANARSQDDERSRGESRHAMTEFSADVSAVIESIVRLRLDVEAAMAVNASSDLHVLRKRVAERLSRCLGTLAKLADRIEGAAPAILRTEIAGRYSSCLRMAAWRLGAESIRLTTAAECQKAASTLRDAQAMLETMTGEFWTRESLDEFLARHSEAT